MRRLWALIRGLPPESATWRREEIPDVERLLDAANQQAYENAVALYMALTAQPGEQLQPPPPPLRLRAALVDEPRPEPRKVETDSRRIATFFAQC